MSARSWGIQPSEFWEMTVSEWMVEADANFRSTPEGRTNLKRDEWLDEAEMTDEEWWAKHGAS